MFDRELVQIEELEKDYLDNIEFILTQDIQKLMNGLRSKDKISDDWLQIFKKSSKQTSDFARGAERIYFWIFNQFGIPNSSPIGSDLFFETHKAFVHIDIKTAKLGNFVDYKGQLPLGANQTSYQYKDKGINFTVNLPHRYKFQNKACLTYFINIIYEEVKAKLDIVGMYLVCAPNGKLSKIYKDKIINKSKNKGKAFRYKFAANPNFELLEGKPKRIKLLYVREDYEKKQKQLFGMELD